MYRNDDIRFMLEQYKAGGANRYVCPQCGRKRCLPAMSMWRLASMLLMSVANATIQPLVVIIIHRGNILKIILRSGRIEMMPS